MNEMITIPISGEITRKELKKPPELQELKNALDGGWLETVPYFNKFEGQGCVAFCDEEGKIHGLPINRRANTLWQDQQGLFKVDDILVGPVVIIKGDKKFLKQL